MPQVDSAIQQGDCIELMREMPPECADLVFADPPFNIGYQYDQYHDKQTDEDYLEWSRAWMEEVHRLLKPAGTFWLAIGDEFAADLKVIAERQIGFTTRSWVIWYYTFGVNCAKKFSRSHAHLFHFVKDPDRFTFNADDPAVRVPSARALVYGDKRANPKGRLPDDTWILRPQDFQSDRYGFDPLDDTWYFARVAGTFKERQGFHGCQMPEQLLGRIVRVSSNPGDQVFDPFVGSGTTLAVAKKLGRQWQGCELSEDYVNYALDRMDSANEGEPLDGPADAIASAPTTANGRRLKGQSLLPTFEPTDFVDDTLVADAAKDEQPTIKPSAADFRDLQRTVIGEAYTTAAAGYSVDRLLADPKRQSTFHDACRQRGLLGGPTNWNHELLRLRKAGKLPKSESVKIGPVTAHDMDQYQFAAEIAWRLTSDKMQVDSIDEILSNLEFAEFFDQQAARFAPGVELADVRWAALDFRKSQHAIAAEAKEFHYVFANREFANPRKLSATAAERFAGEAGVYLLTGAKRVPLFVGETLDLSARLKTHTTASGSRRKAIGFAVIPDSELPSPDYRAAAKYALARRHQPEWNK